MKIDHFKSILKSEYHFLTMITLKKYIKVFLNINKNIRNRVNLLFLQNYFY